MRRGQALVELALAWPLMCLLAFGGAALTRLAAARSGLDAATAAAAATAARDPALDPSGLAATATFQLVASRYPLSRPHVQLRPGGPGQSLEAVGSADVVLDFVRLPGLPGTVHLVAVSTALAEPWRSRP
ncbi:MAG: hypothetical protein NVS9B1_17360 [Candidatus Dormibacteraceae bacterium]